MGAALLRPLFLQPTEGDARLHTGGKRDGGGTLRKHHGSQELLVGKVFFNYCRKQSGWQGHGLSVPPGSAEPSSALPSLQGAAQLGGTSSQDGPSSVKTAFPLALIRQEVKNTTTNSLHVSLLKPDPSGAAGVSTAFTFQTGRSPQ